MTTQLTDEKIQELARLSRPKLNIFMRKLKEEWLEDHLKNLKEAGKEPPTKEDQKILPIAYMEGIKARIKAIKSTPSGQQEVREQEKVEHIIRMNIYDTTKVKLDYNGLHRTALKGKLIIKNPSPLDDSQKKELKDVENMNPAYYANLDKIFITLDDIYTETETKQLKINFPVNKYLGAIDVSKKQNRLMVYQYWEGIAKLYPKVKSAIEGFFESIEASELSPERKEKFSKLYNKTMSDGGELVTQLEYIAIFDDVDATVLGARHRFYNIITEMWTLERLGKFNEDKDEKTFKPQSYKDDTVTGEGAEAVWNEYAASQRAQNIKNEGMGDTIDLDNTDYDFLPEEFKLDVESLTMAADPLLAYEHKKNKKLLGMTNMMQSNLQEELKKLMQIVEDDAKKEGDNEISVNSAGDVERWMNELEETTVIDEGEETPMALPISVMNNVDFAKMYNTDKFTTVESNTKIGIDNLDEIKNFFGDLHDLLRDKEFRGAIAGRSSKRQGKTSIDYRDKRNSSLRAISSRMASMTGRGNISSDFDDIKGKLQTLLDVAKDYYFDPLYSGLLPIQIPQFGSSIGAKVLQMFDKDLAEMGMESVMSSAYDNLFEGSADSVDPDQLNDISTFLKKMFLPNVKITTSLINSGEAAANALSQIFNKEEMNNNYCAALIVHFMKDVEDMAKIRQDFNGEPIGERAEKFNESYKSRKAIPVFALPHWLDMNQGILTSTDPLKKEYDLLKEIFEKVETDLPILLHKLLKAHDAVRKELGKDLIYGYYPLNTLGVNEVINKMQVEEDIDLSHLEVEQIVKAADSHKNISEEYGISGEQVYMVKALFR